MLVEFGVEDSLFVSDQEPDWMPALALVVRTVSRALQLDLKEDGENLDLILEDAKKGGATEE